MWIFLKPENSSYEQNFLGGGAPYHEQTQKPKNVNSLSEHPKQLQGGRLCTQTAFEVMRGKTKSIPVHFLTTMKKFGQHVP